MLALPDPMDTVEGRVAADFDDAGRLRFKLDRGWPRRLASCGTARGGRWPCRCMVMIAVLCGCSTCTGTNAMDDLVVLLLGAGRREWEVFLMNCLWVDGTRLRLGGDGPGVGGGPGVGMHLCLPRL